METQPTTINDILHLFKETDARLNAMFKETHERFKETDIKFKETDIKFKEIADDIKATRAEVGGIGKSNGKMAEEFFFSGLDDSMKIGNIEFHQIHRNMKTKLGQLEDEYDLVLQNSDTIVVVEVKYYLRKKSVKKLYNKKLKNFRKLYPIYNKFKLFGAVAGFFMEGHAVDLAKDYGFFVLGQSGKNMRLINSQAKAYSNGKK